MDSQLNRWLVVLVALLVGMHMNAALDGREAQAQGDGASGHIVALVGEAQAGQQPIYVVDTREQTLLVYEYGLGRSGLHLVAARSIEYDKLMKEFDIRSNHNVSPTVEQVRRNVGGHKKGK